MSAELTPALPVARPQLGADELAAVERVFASGWLGRGPASEQFERQLAERLQVPHVVVVSTGTAALQLAVEALGIGAGDEVIVPSLTYCATYQAVAATGATPVFAEIDDDTLCLDAGDVAARISPRTRAILTVHFAGFAGGRPALAKVAAAHGIDLIEDAAHAFGSTLDPIDGGGPVGSTGNPVCFSFDPIKSLTCGQGGAVVTADDALADRVRAASNLGLSPTEDGGSHVVGPGHRFAMSDLNAAIGLAQLGRFDELANRRREIVTRYVADLGSVPGVRLASHPPERMVPFMFPIRVPAERRATIRAELAADGIATGMHYAPGHRQPYYRSGGPLPVTERACAELVTLPLTPSMTEDQVGRVVAGVDRAMQARYR